MDALVASIVSAFLAAVLAATGTYFTARRALQHQFDASLRDLRLGAYKELWKMLRNLDKYARPEPLSMGKVGDLAESLRRWYFETGGLFLSIQTRYDYFALQDGISSLLAETGSDLRQEDVEFLRVLGSRLRTGMTRDVGTRRTFIFRGDPDRSTRFSPGTYVEERGSRRMVISTKRRIRTYVEERGSRRMVISTKRRIRFPGRGRPLIDVEPTIEVEGISQSITWDPEGSAIFANMAGTNTDKREERLLLIEEGHVIEGPNGWHRSSTGARGSVVWVEEVDK